jgi:hypothetical protein
MVAKMQTALKNPEPKPQEMLFAQNIENLSIIMNLIEKERTSKPDWRDILIENLKACMPSNNVLLPSNSEKDNPVPLQNNRGTVQLPNDC